MILARASAVTTPPQSKIMEGFSLYENAIHRVTIQYTKMMKWYITLPESPPKDDSFS
jgi:hypothetical protein